MDSDLSSYGGYELAVCLLWEGEVTSLLRVAEIEEIAWGVNVASIKVVCKHLISLTVVLDAYLESAYRDDDFIVGWISAEAGVNRAIRICSSELEVEWLFRKVLKIIFESVESRLEEQ